MAVLTVQLMKLKKKLFVHCKYIQVLLVTPEVNCELN